MNCILCGSPVEAKPHTVIKYCDECRIRHNKELKRLSKARHKEQARKMERQRDARYQSIEQIMRMAKEAGMSYGKYVSKFGV